MAQKKYLFLKTVVNLKYLVVIKILVQIMMNLYNLIIINKLNMEKKNIMKIFQLT
jgi:hypothetical protein